MESSIFGHMTIQPRSCYKVQVYRCTISANIAASGLAVLTASHHPSPYYLAFTLSHRSEIRSSLCSPPRVSWPSYWPSHHSEIRSGLSSVIVASPLASVATPRAGLAVCWLRARAARARRGRRPMAMAKLQAPLSRSACSTEASTGHVTGVGTGGGPGDVGKNSGAVPEM